MKYSAAYTLCVLGGKEAPSAKDLKKVIEASGGECDDEKAEALCSELGAKGPLGDVIAAGKDKIFMCGGGGGGGGAAPAAAGGAAAAAPVEVEEEEEVDMGGGMDMFGGDAPAGGGDY
jgi:ribosomal protein L12E/L44/L45/RPP1/RPP2